MVVTWHCIHIHAPASASCCPVAHSLLKIHSSMRTITHIFQTHSKGLATLLSLICCAGQASCLVCVCVCVCACVCVSGGVRECVLSLPLSRPLPPFIKRRSALTCRVNFNITLNTPLSFFPPPSPPFHQTQVSFNQPCQL